MAPFGVRRRSLVLAALALAASALPFGPATAALPTYSSPIVLSPDEKLLWVVNPGDDSVSIIDTATKQVLTKVAVGDEPRSVAIDPANRYAVIANAAGNSVTFLRILDATPAGLDVEPDTRVGPDGELTTGAEPWSVVISPDGRRVFVANAGQDTITVIRPRGGMGPKIIGNVKLRTEVCNGDDPQSHFQPRGLAVTANNARLYTARFLSFTREHGVQATDRGKVGVVCRLDIDTHSSNLLDYQPAARIELAPQDTGFAFPPNNTFPASAFPNQLQSIVIRGSRAYLPNIAASPSAPLRFSLDTFAFVNSIAGVGGHSQHDRHALDLHLGAQTPEAGKKKLFFANVWAIAFTKPNGAANAYVVSAGSDLLVKLDVAADGSLHFTDGDTTTRYIDLNENDPARPETFGDNAGKNPRGIVINKAGTTAYVANQVSTNVSVVDLVSDEVSTTIRTVDLPAPGSKGEEVKVGAEMFFSSRGHFDRPAGTTVATDERLSKDGWQGCASCHFEGLTDGVVWVFGTGPRKSVPLNASFNPAAPEEQRILNYSAIFDEIEDFEINIRTVSGPVPPAGAPNDPDHGLLFQDDAEGGDINLAPATINAFTVPNAGRNEFQGDARGRQPGRRADRAARVGQARDPHAQPAPRQHRGGGRRQPAADRRGPRPVRSRRAARTATAAATGPRASRTSTRRRTPARSSPRPIRRPPSATPSPTSTSTGSSRTSARSTSACAARATRSAATSAGANSPTPRPTPRASWSCRTRSASTTTAISTATATTCPRCSGSTTCSPICTTAPARRSSACSRTANTAPRATRPTS